MKIGRDLREAYRLMREHLGHQQWWPAESPFEVCVGAILVQNTNWSNVERTLIRIKGEGLLEARRLLALSEVELARLLRPCGYFNVKARRLRAFLVVLVENADGDVGRLLSGPPGEVRRRLLSVPGIGPETADSMLLYAGEHLCFVIDAYTRRIFDRHGWSPAAAPYEELQSLCESALRDAVVPAECLDLWRDYHAQLVQIGKRYCRPRDPRCASCPLRSLLPLSSSALRAHGTSSMGSGDGS